MIPNKVLNSGNVPDNDELPNRGVDAAVRRAVPLVVHHGESLEQIATRAYGSGNLENIRRIQQANSSMIGKINAPR